MSVALKLTAESGGDSGAIENELTQDGAAVVRGLLDEGACLALRNLYREPKRFRSRVIMQRHNFGRGEYQYFSYPLPTTVQALRSHFYELLAPIANRWSEALRRANRYPLKHEEYLRECHVAGQLRPTPLLLRYVSGDYNCLHQDLYGDLHFPLQMTVLLSNPERDFSGGEFVLVEQRPRMQSRAHVISLRLGDAVIFPVDERPIAGARGTYRVKMRHGVSKITGGERMTLGLIFHDAG
jgi:hypothetical protein